MRRINIATIATTGALLLAAACSSGSPSSSAGTSTTAPPPSSASTTSTAVSDVLVVVQKYVDAVNRGDGAAAVALFSVDATYMSELAGCTPCTGRDSFEANILRAAAAHTTVTITNPVVNGDTVDAEGEVQSPAFPPGVTRVVGPFSATVRNGEIDAISQGFDRNDPQTATLLNAAAN